MYPLINTLDMLAALIIHSPLCIYMEKHMNLLVQNQTKAVHLGVRNHWQLYVEQY